MKKTLLLCAVICGIADSSCVMMVKLPDSGTLRERLYDARFTEFIIVTKGKSFNALVDKEVPCNEAIKNINDAFADYYKYLLITPKNPPTLLFLEEKQKLLATVVLKDNPKVFKKVLDMLTKREDEKIYPKKSPRANIIKQ